MTYLQYLLKCVVFRQSTKKFKIGFLLLTHALHAIRGKKEHNAFIQHTAIVIVAAGTLFKNDINEEQHYILT